VEVGHAGEGLNADRYGHILYRYRPDRCSDRRDLDGMGGVVDAVETKTTGYGTTFAVTHATAGPVPDAGVAQFDAWYAVVFGSPAVIGIGAHASV